MNATDVERLRVPPLDLTHVLDDHPGDATAIEDPVETFDYGSLADAAHFLADSLGDVGVDAGTRVGVLTTGTIATTITLCALSRRGATAALVDTAALPSYVRGRLRSADIEFLLADLDAEQLLDDILIEGNIDELPTIVAETFTLARFASRADEEASDMIFLDGSRPPIALGWGELVAVGRAIAEKRGLGERSTLTVPPRIDRPGAVAAVFAGLSVGASVRVGRPPERTRLDTKFMHEDKFMHEEKDEQ